jgi:NAD(P)-dependent dehydrogenase (short-subunit alcohol dehydrogenase family)
MRLNGKKALVTGAAAGIGRAIAARLVAEGAGVACVDIDGAQLDATVGSLNGGPGSAFGIVADVGLGAQVESAVDAAVGRLQGLDILINNAGINASGTVETVSPAQWDRVLAVNLSSVYHMCRRAWPFFVRQRRGAIVNMSSIMGMTPVRESFAYSSTKAAIIALTKSLAADGAPLGIRVNCVCPGYVQTPIMDRAHSAETQARLAAQIPARRMAAPAEIAAAFAWLASDEASYVNGAALLVDGAASAGFAGCFIDS